MKKGGMPAYSMNDLTRRGVAAARAGNATQARQLLITATKSDEGDLVAWWWLGQVVDDPKIRHKCLEKAQAIAAASDAGGRIYKELLRESGAPSLPRYRLANKSRSVGDQCPVCSANMTVGEEIVICPTCHRAN